MFSLDSVQNEKKRNTSDGFFVLRFLLLGQESGCETHRIGWRDEVAPGKLPFAAVILSVFDLA